MARTKPLSRILMFFAFASALPLSAAEDLVMITTDDAVAFLPDRLTITTDERVKIIVEGEEANILGETIFIKRNGAASFAADGMQVVGEKAGETELYVIRGGQVFSLPIEVKQGMTQKAEPKTDPAPQATAPELAKNSVNDVVEEIMNAELDSPEQPAAPMAPLKSKNTFVIRAFDDRSDPNDNVVYPAGDISIEIPALNISADTNVRGETRLELPTDSRFMVFLNDRSGRFINTQKEIYTGHADDPNVKINVMRDFNFSLMNRVSGATQYANRSSLCGVVKVPGLQEGQAHLDLAVSLDRPADGPYYFNQLGLIDLTVGKLERNGRFCYFNVEPGLAAFSIFSEEKSIFTQPLFFVSGYHQEEEFSLSDQFGFGVQVSVQPDAETYFRKPEIQWNEATGIVDLVPFGMDQKTRSDAMGVVSLMNQRANLSNPRLFVFVDEPDLMPTVYQLAPLVGFQSLPVLPVFPRGFTEDLALQMDAVPDERFGSVIAHFRYGADEKEQKAVSIQLMDAYGRYVPAQNYSTYNEETAVYINIAPGYYQMIATDPDGSGRDRVIDVQSVYVYSGALTSVVSGFRSLAY